MAVTIKWKDNSSLEKGHRIYKSNTYFTPDNLPSPLVDLGPNIEEYEDTASNAGENWYILSAYILDYEVFSEPFIPDLTTIYTHDIFGDGSAVATYNFDGDVTDLGGNYNGSWNGTESYTSGVITQAADIIHDSEIYANMPLLENGSVSFFLNIDSSANFTYDRIIGIGGYDYSSGWAIFKDNSSNSLYIYNNSGSKDTGIIINFSTIHHIVIAFEYSSDFTIYINGVSSFSGTQSFSPDNTLRIGRSGGYSFNGFVDQLRVFNRPLTQQEVNTLYQEGVL